MAWFHLLATSIELVIVSRGSRFVERLKATQVKTLSISDHAYSIDASVLCEIDEPVRIVLPLSIDAVLAGVDPPKIAQVIVLPAPVDVVYHWLTIRVRHVQLGQ
jgi:hypothetical protein